MNLKIFATLIGAMFLSVCGCDSPAGETNAPSSPKTNAYLDAVTGQVQATLDQMELDLKLSAELLAKTGISSPQAEETLASLCKLQPRVIDATIISPDGKMLLIMPDDYKKYQGTNIADQEQVRQVIETKAPVLSDQFETVEGTLAVDYEWPIVDAKKKYLASLSIIFKPSEIINDAIAKVGADSQWDVAACQLDGQALLAGKVGQKVITSYPTITSLKKGIITPAANAAKSASDEIRWSTVESSGTQWRIIIIRHVAK